MRVNFNLRATKPNTKRQPINAVIRWNAQRLVYSTNCGVFPKNWDANKQRVKNTTSEPLKDSVNAFLSNFEAVVSKFAASHIAPSVPTIAQLKAHLDSIFAPSVSATVEPLPVKITLFSFIESFIQDRKEHSTLSKTAAKYGQMWTHLQAFAKERKRIIDFEHINLEFCAAFVKYLYARNMRQNSCNKIISLLKAVLNDATERGYNTTLIYKSRKFNVPTENVNNVYLSVEELTTLLDFDLSTNPRLERVRDLFLVGCWTGLRFSDFTNIKPENITHKNGFDQLEIKTIKTGQDVVIPLHPVVKSILAKYDGKTPPSLSNQKMNAYLKDLCETVGFYDRVLISNTIGGKRQDVAFYKYELITTHTARRSFATNAFKSGEFSSLQIMRITGHTSESSFKKYIKITNEENAVLMSKARFFGGTKVEAVTLKKVS